jgi:hypothetical protein
MQLKKIALKNFLKILTWLYRDSTNQLRYLPDRQTTFIHTVLCANRTRSSCLMVHSPNWLEEPVKFRLKGTKLSKRFSKTTSQFKLVFAVCRQKPFQPIITSNIIMWSMEIKEIHIHASGRFIVLKTMTSEIVLQLIIKRKLYRTF